MVQTPTTPSNAEQHDVHREAVLDDVVAEVGLSLASAFQSLLRDLPGAPHRPQELARELRINKDLSSRILKATESRDPIAITHLMPGPEPLRRLIRAASRKNINSDTITAAEQSVQQFERLIRNVAGDRGGLDTIISAWLPEVREKTELLSKQAVFKGMSQIKGAATDVDYITRFVHPAASGDDYDYVMLSGSLGLRRLRPGASITVNLFPMHGPADSRTMFTLDGKHADGRHDLILPEFCSEPLPAFELCNDSGMTSMRLAGDEVGVNSAADLAWAHVHRSSKIRNVFSTTNMPVRRGICDLMIHADIAEKLASKSAADAGRTPPSLEIYDTTERGIATFGDPARRDDLLDLRTSVDCLGRGISRFRCTDIPRYIEMIDHVCSKMNWNVGDFYGFRCAIDYPVYGSQIIMAFDPQVR